MANKKSIDDFLKEAKETHGDKYDYSKVEYRNTDSKVCIICPKHGEFCQTPYKHIRRKQGCPICGNEMVSLKKTKTTQQFIDVAKQIHGDKYDYSKAEYINNSTNVCIICPIHGEFEQTPSNHLQGKGCPKCHGGVKMTLDEFIQMAQSKYGDKYDYSKVKYTNAHTKVCIICPIHGEFFQTPNDHININKYGCPRCATEHVADARKSSTKDFIQKAKQVHGDNYDYYKVEYINNSTKICIICPKHGEFWQTPANHLVGKGCPICNSSKLEGEIREFLLEHGFEFVEQKKFEWLKNQRLDFFLPQYNVAIECQGIQHFKPIDFANKGHEWAEKQYKKVCALDSFKRVLCNKNNITLIYYSNLGIDYPYEVIEDKEELINNIKNNI